MKLEIWQRKTLGSTSEGESVVSYTFFGDGLKRREVFQAGVVTTFVWDGSEYLQDRSSWM